MRQANSICSVVAVLALAQASSGQERDLSADVRTRSPSYGLLSLQAQPGDEAAGSATLPADEKPAGEGMPRRSEWEFEFAPYLWMSSLRATVDAGPVSTTADACFTELLKELEMGAMLRLEGRRGSWGFYLEGIYLSLENEARAKVGRFRLRGVEIEAEFTQASLDFGALYRFGDRQQHFDITGGGRFVHLDNEVSIGPFRGSGGSTDFVAPVVGGTYRVLLRERWILSVHADVGGFGAGEAPDLTWGATGIVGYQVNDRVTLGLGYRYYSIGASDDNPSVDVVYHGPIMGLVWSF